METGNTLTFWHLEDTTATPWFSCRVKICSETKPPLCIDSLPFFSSSAPHCSMDTRRPQKHNTSCRVPLGFVNIKNRDLTHHTKQYQTQYYVSLKRDKWFIKSGLFHLYNNNGTSHCVDFQSVGHCTQSSTFRHCHMLGWKGRKYHISTTNPNTIS